MWKKGINLTLQFGKGAMNAKKKDIKNAEKAIPRPGYGKYDLDTGLSAEEKRKLLLKQRPKSSKAA